MDLLSQLASSSQDDIYQAQALDFQAYTSPAVFQLEQNKIWRQDWVFILASADLTQAGDYYAFELSAEAVVIIRQADGQLIALSNICRHRGTPILDNGYGQADKLTCPYHAWTYDQQGELKAAPFSGDVVIDKSAHKLGRYYLEQWQGLVFVSLQAPTQSVAEKFADLTPYFKRFNCDQFIHSHPGKRESWRSNWKLIMENGMESYHLFKVHKETLETITPTKQAFYLHGGADFSVTGGAMHSPKSFWDWFDKADEFLKGHYLLFSLPPNFVGILTLDAFAWINVLPLDANNSMVYSGAISPYKDSASKSELSFVEDFFAEDKFICERVQQGMQSQLSRGGKLVEMEQVLVDFRHYWGQRLFGNAKPEIHYYPEADEFRQT